MQVKSGEGEQGGLRADVRLGFLRKQGLLSGGQLASEVGNGEFFAMELGA